MNGDVSAVPAGGLLDSFTKLTEKPVIKKKTTSQDKIATLANSDAYKALQEVIDAYIENLENIPVDPKDDVALIGYRYMASRVTIEYLKDIRDLPERYKKIKPVQQSQDE